MSLAPSKTAPYLCPELAGTLMAPEEFDAVTRYKEGYRYELVHGVLVVNPIPRASETGPNEMLGYWLLAYREHHAEGSALDLTLPQQYVATRTSRRLADRLIWTGLGRVPVGMRDRPSIAVEFVSRRRRDRLRDYEDKRREYAEVGIPEYWIFDRFQRIMTVVHNQPGGQQEVIVREQDTYRTTLLPGFELPLAPLLAAADRCAQFG